MTREVFHAISLKALLSICCCLLIQCFQYVVVLIGHINRTKHNKEAKFNCNYLWTHNKMDVLIAFSSLRAQQEVVLFWCQIKVHIFLIITPKFLLQIHYTLEIKAENVPLSSIPFFFILDLLKPWNLQRQHHELVQYFTKHNMKKYSIFLTQDARITI